MEEATSGGAPAARGCSNKLAWRKEEAVSESFGGAAAARFREGGLEEALSTHRRGSPAARGYWIRDLE